MNRKLKNLGMVIVAALAVAALSAPAASAAEFHTGPIYSLSGSQVGTDTTTFKAGTVTCNEITYSGEMPIETTSTLTLTPRYAECKAFGYVNATVDMNGCEYVFHTGEGGSMDIACAAGNSIVLTVFNCWVTIGPQSLKAVSYSNEAVEGSYDVRIAMNITSMSYTQHSKSFPGCSSGSFSDGQTKGTITLGVSVKQGIWYE